MRIKLTMNHKKTLNPESMPSIIPHALYNNHKQARKQIQSQREEVQHTTAFLERQARRTSKELEQQQRALMEFYKLKESRFEQAQKKEQLRREREEQLNQMRRTNNHFRETSEMKRRAVRDEWVNMNRTSAFHIKSDRSESEKKLNEEKQIVNSLLKKRNEVFSKAIILGTTHSRAKSLYNKKFQSSLVKNDLISIEERIKSNEMEKINMLNARQQELMSIVEHNRREKHEYAATIEEVRTLPFDQVTHKINYSTKAKGPRSQRSNSRSDSLMF